MGALNPSTLMTQVLMIIAFQSQLLQSNGCLFTSMLFLITRKEKREENMIRKKIYHDHFLSKVV